MEPRIQYAQTADGVSIAFWTLGEGTPLVCVSNVPWSHIQLEWQYPDYRRYYERLAEKRKLIRYDSRGCGLSDREVANYSLDAFLMDLETVVQRLGLERFALLGPFNGGPVAIAYAARYPEQVSHLGLWCSWARWADAYGPSRLQAFRALRGAGDWELYTETMAHASFGWSAGEASRFAAFMRECITREAIGAVMAALTEIDVTPLLSQVSSPTLVLHRREASMPGLAGPKAIAAGISDARLLLLEGDSLAPWVGDMEAVASAIDEFLGEREEPMAKAQMPMAGAFRTVLFTDIVAHTAIMRRLGDEKGREVLREHERITREALKSHGGTEVKTMGDGFLASFSSVTRAVECAIALQQAFARHNETAAEPVHIRVGLNAGEPIEEEGDIFGETVILAARVAAQAEGGEILASLAVRELCAGKGFLFADRGEQTLRGFEDPVRLYEVRWRDPL
jgi:class 3 adenylate cyclase